MRQPSRHGPGRTALPCNSITVFQGEPSGGSHQIMDDDDIMNERLRVKVIAGYIGRLAY